MDHEFAYLVDVNVVQVRQPKLQVLYTYQWAVRLNQYLSSVGHSSMIYISCNLVYNGNLHQYRVL